jgi:hypothetical protein
MRFDQTGEVLGFIERFHEDIARAYVALGERIPQRRAGLLLDYMSAREMALAEAVRNFAHDSPDPALKEWDPFNVDDTAIRARIKEGLHAEASPDQLLSLGLDVAEWFEKLFVRLKAKSGTPEQKELFENLRERTEQEKHKLARNGNMLMDF